MTTVFGISSHFWSVDSLWTPKGWGKAVDDTLSRKYIQFDGEISFFAGDELPILLEQAHILEVVSEEDYIAITARLSESGEEMVYLAVAEHDGSIIETDGAFYNLRNSAFVHLGTGGKHACDFFHYFGCRKKKLSQKGCNIVGSIQYAAHKDPSSGGAVTRKVWRANQLYGHSTVGYDVLALDDQYIAYLRMRTEQMLNTIKGGDMTLATERAASNGVLASTLRAGHSENSDMRKVTVSAAVARSARRKARKAALGQQE
ncbi:hypothetical protein [Aeromonas sp. QDB03]|uniref:hypothetical protein n=1 Tax=Aeromonas sp. QDB03 TaxID=2989839 RepID=UPI0022E3B35B|nr:hypothetical protein [Aeromonas sp. QDB03]